MGTAPDAQNAARREPKLLLAFGLGFMVQGLGFRVQGSDASPVMENQMEKNIENEIESLGPFSGVKGLGIYYPNNRASTGKTTETAVSLFRLQGLGVAPPTMSIKLS